MKYDILSKLDKKSNIRVYDASKLISMHLLNIFNVFEVRALSSNFFILELRDNTVPLQNVETQFFVVKEKMQEDIALYFDNLSDYEYNKLVNDGVPFITGDNNYYIPFLALNLKRNRNISSIGKSSNKFTIGGQLLFLYMLYSNDYKFSSNDIMNKLKMNSMQFSRSANDLLDKKLLDYSVTGRTGRMKTYYIKDKKEYFKNGQHYLFFPTQKEFYVNNEFDTTNMVKAGITALSDHTMLSNDGYNIYATYKKKYNDIIKYAVDYKIGINENYNKILLLKYDPALLLVNGNVDPITLSLTIEDKDERIESAIDELLGRYEWYEA